MKSEGLAHPVFILCSLFLPTAAPFQIFNLRVGHLFPERCPKLRLPCPVGINRRRTAQIPCLLRALVVGLLFVVGFSSCDSPSPSSGKRDQTAAPAQEKTEETTAPPTAALPTSAPTEPIPTPTASARLAVILDDFGYSFRRVEEIFEIECPLTLAVLPDQPFSQQVAHRAWQVGHEVILHCPLEPDGLEYGLEPDTILTTMSEEKIRDSIDRFLLSVPHCVGANNHMGSKATTDVRVMRCLLDELHARSLFFIDSRTTPHSVVLQVAEEIGIPCAASSLFLDNVSEEIAISERIREAVDRTLKRGSLIVIAHGRPLSIRTLRECIPEIEAAGVRLVYVSQLVKQ